jgi:hypothetical protein
LANSHQPAVLFSHIKPATSNQPAVLFSQKKPAPAISHQLTEHAVSGYRKNLSNSNFQTNPLRNRFLVSYRTILAVNHSGLTVTGLWEKKRRSEEFNVFSNFN